MFSLCFFVTALKKTTLKKEFTIENFKPSIYFFYQSENSGCFKEWYEVFLRWLFKWCSHIGAGTSYTFVTNPMCIPVDVLIDSDRQGVCVSVEIIHNSSSNLLKVLGWTLTVSQAIYKADINVRCGLSCLESYLVKVLWTFSLYLFWLTDLKPPWMDGKSFCQQPLCTVK